jgi:citrate synthase
MWLHDRMEPKIEAARERIERVAVEHKNKKVGEIHVNQIFNGLRGMDILLSDVSFVDPHEGLQYRGYKIKDVLELLPKADGSEFPLAGGLYYLLLVGDIPTRQDALDIEEEWRRRSDLPYHGRYAAFYAQRYPSHDYAFTGDTGFGITLRVCVEL